MRQEVRFCESFDGTRIAYSISGEGPPLMRAPHWLAHLEYEAESPVWRPWLEALSSRNRLIRMDQRGCGLSDWEAGELSLESAVRDLEAVVDAAGLERFSLLGHSQGASIAIEYTARNPERVSHLVLLGGYLRGALRRGLPPERIEELEAQLKLVEAGWGREDASYRQMFALGFMPGATMEQIQSLSELQRKSASTENALRLIRGFWTVDVTPSAARVRCPTLVVHAREDRRVPLDEGRLAARLIPGARFVTLESVNHILLSHEPAFARFLDELHAFVPCAAAPGAAPAESGAGAPLRQRLTAILAADAEGYSRRMAEDDRGTLAALDAARAVFREQIAAQEGRVVDMAGDSVLAVFDSAAGAVAAALAVQQRLDGAGLRFRIGVHLGDVIEKPDGSIYGDGVNVAARLQALAEAGGICASEAVRVSVGQRLRAAFDDRGEQQMKNIAAPLRVFGVRPA